VLYVIVDSKLSVNFYKHNYMVFTQMLLLNRKISSAKWVCQY